MAIDPFLDAQLSDQCVDVPGLFLLHHAVDGHGPRAGLQVLSVAVDAFVGSEFVEVVVGEIHVLFGDVAIHAIAQVRRRRIHVGRGDQFILRLRLTGEAKRGDADGPKAHALQQAAAVQKDVLRRGRTLGQFPPSGLANKHSESPAGMPDCMIAGI